jgi:hypothetical protein
LEKAWRGSTTVGGEQAGANDPALVELLRPELLEFAKQGIVAEIILLADLKTGVAVGMSG